MFKYFLLILPFIGNIHSSSATIIATNEPKADQIFIILGTDVSVSLTDYIKLKPSDLKRLLGHKLTLKETFAYKISQKQIKKAIRKDGSFDMLAFTNKTKEPFKWNWGGFFLGLLLPILGLIITAFFKDDQRKDRITSAAIGTIIACAVFIILVASSF